MSTVGWHLHRSYAPRVAGPLPSREAGAGTGGRDAAGALSEPALEVALHQATVAVAIAREAWGTAEREWQDAAWAWLQACIAHRDLLLSLARAEVDVLVAPAHPTGRGERRATA